MPGSIGNRNASKNKPWEDVLRRAIAQDDGVRLRQAAERLLDQAAEGDMQALKELGDRLDGKAKQSIDIEGKITLSEAQIDAKLARLKALASRD